MKMVFQFGQVNNNSLAIFKAPVHRVLQAQFGGGGGMSSAIM